MLFLCTVKLQKQQTFVYTSENKIAAVRKFVQAMFLRVQCTKNLKPKRKNKKKNHEIDIFLAISPEKKTFSVLFPRSIFSFKIEFKC